MSNQESKSIRNWMYLRRKYCAGLSTTGDGIIARLHAVHFLLKISSPAAGTLYEGMYPDSWFPIEKYFTNEVSTSSRVRAGGFN